MLAGVIYNTASTMIMSVAFTENAQEDANLQAQLLPLGGAVPSGQSLAVLSGLTQQARVADLIAAAQSQLGLALAAPAKCAVVDPNSNLVVDVVLADPARHPFAGKLVFAAAADVGWIYSPLAQTLTSPPQIDPKTLLPLPQVTISVGAVAASL